MFLRPDTVTTESGAQENKYIVAAMRHAEITDYSREHQQVQSALTEGESYVIKTWAVPGTDTTFKVEWNGVKYDLIRVVKVSPKIGEYYIERNDLCEE